MSDKLGKILTLPLVLAAFFQVTVDIMLEIATSAAVEMEALPKVTFHTVYCCEFDCCSFTF